MYLNSAEILFISVCASCETLLILKALLSHLLHSISPARQRHSCWAAQSCACRSVDPWSAFLMTQQHISNSSCAAPPPSRPFPAPLAPRPHTQTPCTLARQCSNLKRKPNRPGSTARIAPPPTLNPRSVCFNPNSNTQGFRKRFLGAVHLHNFLQKNVSCNPAKTANSHKKPPDETSPPLSPPRALHNSLSHEPAH